MPAITERAIPSTGEPLPVLAMGCWGIGGWTPGNTSYGATDDSQSLATVAAALDHGVRFFDLAPAYGSGHAEEILGRSISGRRDQAFIATKVGRPRFDIAPDFHPDVLVRHLEASLRRLGVDHVDLIQLHDPSPQDIADGRALDSLRATKTAGLARYIGVSCKSPADGLPLIDAGVDFLQVNLNLMDQRAHGDGLLDAAHGKVAIIARTPLCFGFLSGAIPDDPKFAEGDHRNNWKPAQIRRWIEGAREFTGLLAREQNLPILDLALRYCLSHPAVTAVLPGMMRPDEVAANVAAVDGGALPEPVLAEIFKHYQSTEFFLPR